MKKLRQYLEELNKLAADHPEALEMDVVTWNDPCNNGCQNEYVTDSPSIGCFKFGDFTTATKPEDANAVCLN